MVYKIKSVNNINSINWEEVPKANIDRQMWTNNPYPKSYAQMVFNKEYGFICLMTCYEVNPKRTCTHDNDDLKIDSALEAYFMFDNERYMNLENNANGARKQAIRYNRENKTYIYANEFKGFEVIPNIYSDRWTIMIKLPLWKLVKLYPSIKLEEYKSGFTFKGNFYKVHELVGTPSEHYVGWTKINNPFPECHLKEQFGTFIIE